MYVISLYRYDVCIYSGSREQIEIFVRQTSRSLELLCVSQSFSLSIYVGATYCNLFYDCSSLAVW